MDVGIGFVGDVLLARRDRLDQLFERAVPALRRSDLVFFNNESPYASVGSPHAYGAVPHDPASLAALGHAGFDACTMANNHCLGWGADAMLETVGRLTDMGISVCGVGANVADATKPIFVERGGSRFGFLGYNCIGPKGYMAEADKAGCAMVRIHTHYEPYEYTPGAPALAVTKAYGRDLEALRANISAVRQECDAVVVYFHWGLHFTRGVLCDYQPEVGHACVDAGAAAVLGCGPHMLSGVELYRDAPIFYSLGNFCLAMSGAGVPDADIAPSRLPRSMGELYRAIYEGTPHESDRSMIANLTFSGGRVVRSAFRPVLLDAAGTPTALSADSPGGKEVLSFVDELNANGGLATRLEVDGDDVVVMAGEPPERRQPIPLTP